MNRHLIPIVQCSLHRLLGTVAVGTEGCADDAWVGLVHLFGDGVDLLPSPSVVPHLEPSQKSRQVVPLKVLVV